MARTLEKWLHKTSYVEEGTSTATSRKNSNRTKETYNVLYKRRHSFKNCIYEPKDHKFEIPINLQFEFVIATKHHYHRFGVSCTSLLLMKMDTKYALWDSLI